MLLIGSIFKIFLHNKIKRRQILSKITSWISNLALKLANIYVTKKSFDYYHPDKNYLIVANHMGMLDILAILSHIPSVFVTSYELKETPIVGWLTDAGGCVFVERRNRQNIQQEVAEISNGLKARLNICFFPEATSTNGDEILPFKKSLFVSAVDTPAEILPITINYIALNNKPVTKSNRDFICWYGNQSFFPALWRLMSNFRIDISLTFHPPLKINSVEERRLIAEETHRLINSAFLKFN